MENATVWLIVAKSNLHVGNENMSSYGLIDKAIQRDALTGLPCINSSSLKGALNEYMTQEIKMDSAKRKEIFGVDKQNSKSETKKGNSVFFDANILFLPVQDDNTLYKLVSCEKVLQRFVDKMRLFGSTYTLNMLENKMGERGFSYTNISEEEFISRCSDENLPIVARNKLDGGESCNLWYEQFLPQETIMGTIIISKESSFKTAIADGIIQIGANATIGYGYCNFIEL